MQLRQEYQRKIAQVQSGELSFAADLPKTIPPVLWFDSLAYFEVHMDEPESDRLYDALFEKGADFPANLYLDDEDYLFFSEQVRYLLERYAQQHPQAWVELGMQYVLCRRHVVDKQKASLYLRKAIEAQVPVAQALYLYYNQLGVLSDLERDEAKIQLDALATSGNVWGIAYAAHLNVWTDRFEEVPEQIAVLRDSDDEKLLRHYYEALQFYFSRKADRGRQLEVLEEGIAKADSRYCRFVATELKRAAATTTNELQSLIPDYQEVFEYGITDAAVQIALIKLQMLGAEANNKQQDEQDIVFYLQKAYDYNNNYAGYRLACLYLYNDSMLDPEKGLALLTQLDEQSDYAEAQIELAEIYLEGRLLPADEQQAWERYEKLAAKDIPYAKLRLGNMLEYGCNGTESDYQAAFAYYRDAAQAKLPQALYQVGRYIKYGIHGTAPDAIAALPYFEEAAGYNNAAAVVELGLASELQSEPDYKQAFDYFARAAELGYPYAYYLKGLYLEQDYHGAGAPQPAEAFAAFEAGAGMHDLNCLYELGRCYRGGIGTEVNLDKMIDLYQQAADRNHVRAMTDLALCYEYGFAVAQDPYKASEYITKAADLGFPYAQYVLGRYYLNGLVQQDTARGLQLLEQAANQQVGEALLLLGDYYFFDYEQLEEYDKGFAYYERAQQLGYLSDGLGMCYEFGVGVEAHPPTAFSYYKQAAERGNQEAIYRLGRCYYFGIGTEEDKKEAFRNFLEVAHQGNTYARYFAGVQLLEGEGVEADLNEGVEWIRKAAEAEYAEAQFKLANCYLMGDGVEEDEDMALEWFERAAANGHEEAIRLTKKSRR
ncbi:sel1 repeat family protein [Sphingobacterium sp. InxBP1]|uniref:SEL1-like repeat protein n=1 Tax=Sphingobacterium sp. InxBP1 TaxID=2870328 RepID=UPI002244E879|nr:tetratricopeptide repeat protein [Sphingobacterium sp. InxBP1]MCW8310747.1 sel1 repeat family protein [Sphingobacterium sp. InxBP1]